MLDIRALDLAALGRRTPKRGIGRNLRTIIEKKEKSWANARTKAKNREEWQALKPQKKK